MAPWTLGWGIGAMEVGSAAGGVGGGGGAGGHTLDHGP